ncbi:MULTISPECIES: preprotein translocase subunit SecG [unclassified Rhizobium]|uniref:preprotein translocase subunit SecG n=1 Tax=unclassified Rhizobium TaxID=2613769 RepID=UPI0007130D00|nr:MULTISPECIES: preprotein translocase subunit SecG [unclassified Rhizobium]KQS88319.1 preprotein translocase subunit SecG [Rhizobium sp. Leaf391]KQT03910.1 preprotein translocase subunit SecG [Rhizobium sp. Leaf386]KQT95628.1 preprotein translocase subunit SecG [Rhizobium sp. Leaf453]
MQTVLLVIYLMVVLALIGVVLIQRSEGGGLGIGGGSGFMSARGTANALTRTTAILATLFFVLALGMGILSRYQPNATDVLDRIPGTTNNGNGVLNDLGGATTPPAGETPAQTPTQSGTDTQTPAAQTPATQTPATTTTETPATQTPATETKPATSSSDVPSGQ